MQSNFKLFLVLSSFYLLTSCNSRHKQEILADQYLSNIKTLINQNSLNAAKIKIDSLHLLFPRLVNKRKIAASLEDTIIRRESSRSLEYCDSILPLKQHEADSIQRNFRFEKNTTYQQFGNYVYKSQITENNTNRTYLKAYVNENADFYLVSNYCGSKIEYTNLIVSSNEIFIRTDTILTNNSANHIFFDGGTCWESITFKNDEDKGVAMFISQNSAARIKVSLKGKKSFDYYLLETDKKAISETYRLWVIKKDVRKLQEEIIKAKNRIKRINKSF
jgi:hypothetical protein